MLYDKKIQYQKSQSNALNVIVYKKMNMPGRGEMNFCGVEIQKYIYLI